MSPLLALGSLEPGGPSGSTSSPTSDVRFVGLRRWRTRASSRSSREPSPPCAGGRVALVAESSDRLEPIDGGGGLVVIRRAYLPLYRATLEDGAHVPTGPVDVALLGVGVPPGKRRLVVDVSSAAERAAGWVAGFAALALVALGVAPYR